MASATRKVLPPAPPIHAYTLDLTEEEAEILVLVTGKIGGPSYGARGKTEAIHDALTTAGVRWLGGESAPRSRGNIIFEENN